MRGEDSDFCCWVGVEQGSPPHARGRPTNQPDPESVMGITPACAGKTCRGRTPTESVSDHPRMRGEDLPFSVRDIAKAGSPPHARGRRQTCSLLHRTSLDHPRMRGEDGNYAEYLTTSDGSPPHARGRRQILIRVERRDRITPACAGKTAVFEDGDADG